MFKFVPGIAMILIFSIPSMESVEILVDGKSLDDDCLRCICVASSECDDHVRCHTEGQDEYYCGPFQLSRDYWTASGAPGSDPKNPMDFEECANNIHCAIKTVNQYLKLKQEDCDRDGLITCQDYALIHKFGPNKCMEKELYERSKFWTRFDNCFSRENTTFSA